MKDKSPVKKIISGGQTGADFGGLLAGKELGLETGGTAPLGFKTENGSNLELKNFNLVESDSRFYNDRTTANIKNSTGTIVFGNTNSIGSKSTIAICKRLGKPYIVNPTKEAFLTWLAWNNIQTLNVAGNRESVSPSICEKVRNFLVTAIKEIS
ncbi:MAG: putative molybdenum carrier protein [Candidatus Caldatribacteriota bacterium]|nr:putative molybdenum carrier protein [Patescibacteria group bacterium]